MDFKKVRIIFFTILLFSISNSIISETINDAIALMKKEDYKESIKVLDKILKDNPEYPIAYMYRGYAFMMTEEYSKALQDYKKSDQLSSTIDSLSGVQWALLANGQYEESISAGNRVLELDPINYYANLRIADAYLGKKDYTKASEKYKLMQSQYGKNADLLWKIGLCEYYAGNKKEATKLFQEGAKLSPEHKGLQYSLANSEAYPIIAIIPEHTSFSFRGSDFLGSGQKSGLGASFSPNETWNVRASVVNDRTQNLNSSKGVENYILDPINLAYLSQYGYLSVPSSIPGYYLNQPINLYNLEKLTNAQDYATNKYSLGLSYKISERFSANLSPQTLQSNSSYLNGGYTVQAGVSYTNKYTISVSAANIYTPTSSGGQLSATLYFPFFEKFYSSSTLTGQSMRIKTTETVLLSNSPFLATTETVRSQKGYGFFQQEIGYALGYFYFGIGGRYGTARTPMMGENWIYTGFDLLYGGYGQIGFKMQDITFQIQYSQDKWLDSRNERPTSDAIKFTLIWRI